MANNGDVKFYPDEQVKNELLRYQDEQGLTKSKATEELVKKGLIEDERTIIDDLYWELAKITGVIGLVLMMVNNLSELITVPLIWYGIILVAAAFLFMGMDHVDFSIRKAIGRSDDDAGKPARS